MELTFPLSDHVAIHVANHVGNKKTLLASELNNNIYEVLG